MTTRPGPGSDEAAAERARRRRRAEVFGDVLPQTTGDERAEGDDPRERDSTDDWLRRQVPPHHG